MTDSADLFKTAFDLIKDIKEARERQDTKRQFFDELLSDNLPELVEHPDFISYVDIIWKNYSKDDDSIHQLLKERYNDVNGKFNQAQVIKNATIAYQLLTTCAKEEFNRSDFKKKYLDCLTKIVLKKTKALISSNGEDKVFEICPVERRIDDFGSWEIDRFFGHMKLFLVSSDLSKPLPEQWRCDKDTKFRVEEREAADLLLADISAGKISIQQFLQRELAIYDINQLSSMKERLQALQILSVKDLGNVTDWSDLRSHFPAHYKQLEIAIKRYSSLNKENPATKKDERTEAELLCDWNKVRRFLFYEAGLEDELKNCGQLEPKALEKGFEEQKKNKDFDGGPSLAHIKKVLLSFTLPDKKLRKNSQGIMLYGPPGTGKTELCKVIIKKAGLFGLVPPLASSELNRSKVGETERIVMAIFHRALYVPYLLCCIAIDEIDALVPKRNDKSGEHKVDVLCLLLSLLGGIKNVPNVFMIASTNRLNKIDDWEVRSISIRKAESIGLRDFGLWGSVAKERLFLNFKANRESAFVHALAAAATLQAVSRGCKNGDISTCTCSKSKRPENLNRDWIWGGCGDNIEYGYKFAKTFIDIADKSVNDERYTFTSSNGRAGIEQQQDRQLLKQKRNYQRYMLQRSAAVDSDEQQLQRSPGNLLRKSSRVDPNKTRARRLINLHNNEAGRRAVYRMVKVECKCHGVSGSCSMKTCWLKVPNFREIGDYLKEKYDSAIEVKYEAKKNQLHERYKRYSKPTKEDLIYMDESPNFCRENRRHLIKGTRGRQCNKNSDGPDGCRNLCCGRGYYVERKLKEEQCNCKFQWCCTVKCETCITEVETYICK